MPVLSTSLLGPFVATIGGTPINKFRTKTVQGLFIYLAVESLPDSNLSREQLSELFYPGYTLQTGRKNLRQTLYELRQDLVDAGQPAGQPLIVADRQTVALSPHWQIQLDINAFETGIEDGRVARMEEVAALYRGDFLCDFYLPDSAQFESWAANRRAFYRRRVIKLYDRLTIELMDSRQFERAERYARLQTALDEFNEKAARQLMKVLAAGGQRSAALTEFERIRGVLARQLEIAPTVETEDLYQLIKLGSFQLGIRQATGRTRRAGEPARERLADAQRVLPNNLPLPPTPFIGREGELQDLLRMLCDESTNRLVTLLGPGGCGKSRLAIEVGFQLTESAKELFPDGIWYVPLAALSSAESVVLEIAKALKLTFMANDVSRKQQLTGYLAQRQMLLILDNYEHLLEEDIPSLPADILGEAGGVTILVTSRIRLNIRGEQLFPVSGLTYPRPGPTVAWPPQDKFSAIALFATSARRIRPDFDISESNWPAVVNICQILDGLPLAIELAASWIEVLSTAEIAAEVGRGIDFLAGNWTDIPDRQRTMRAVYNNSWQLLTQGEQETLKRLSIFRGPFKRSAAEAVVGEAVLQNLLSLMNKSWLTRDDRGYFLIHEVLRQFCHQELRSNIEEWREARSRHATYYAGWLQELGLDLRCQRQQQALSAIDGSFENIRLAWGWLTVEGDLEALARQLLPAIFLFCTTRSRGMEVVAMVGAAEGGLDNSNNASIEANILRIARVAAIRGGYLPKQLDPLLQGIDLPTDEIIQLSQALNDVDPLQVDALWPVTIVVIYAWVTRSHEIASDRLRKLSLLYQENGQEWAAAFALKYLGFIVGSPMSMTPYDNDGTLLDNFDQFVNQAVQLLSDAAARFEKLGDKLELADSLRLIGWLTYQTDPDTGLDSLLKAKALLEVLGDVEMSAKILLALSLRSLWMGEIDEAFDYFRARHAALKANGNLLRYGLSLCTEALHAMRFYSIDHARRLRLENQEINRSLKQESNLAWDALELGVIEVKAGNLALARALLGQAITAFDKMDNEYGRMFYESGMGDLSLKAGDYQEAINYYHASLKQAQSLSHSWLIGCVLSHLSLTYLAAGDLSSARRYCRKALKSTQDISHFDLSLIAMLALAGIKAKQGDPESALLLATFVRNHHLCWLEYKAQARTMIETSKGQLPEGRGAAIQKQALTSTKEALLEMVLGEDAVKAQ